MDVPTHVHVHAPRVPRATAREAKCATKAACASAVKCNIKLSTSKYEYVLQVICSMRHAGFVLATDYYYY